MAVMFELWYPPPADARREAQVTEKVKAFGGRLDFREEAARSSGICLTYEFEDWAKADQAAAALRNDGYHVEGPMEYAD